LLIHFTMQKLNSDLAKMSADLQQTLAENNELKRQVGAGSAAAAAPVPDSDGKTRESLEGRVRELTALTEQQLRDIEEVVSQNDTLSASFNVRLQEVEDMEDLVGSMEAEIEALRSHARSSAGSGGDGGEVSALRAELVYAQEKEASLVKDKEYAVAQNAESVESLGALEKVYSVIKERATQLTKELAGIQVERDASKASETETLCKMRQENAGLMSEAVRTTQLLSTLQEDIVLHRENLTSAQYQTSEMRRAVEEKNLIVEKLNDKVAFLQAAIETVNDEKIGLTDESVKHLDLLHKMESDYYKKKEELEDVKKKLSKQVEESKQLKEDRDRFAASSNPDLLASLEANTADGKKDNERMKKRISEMQAAMAAEEKVSAGLREELRLGLEDLDAARAQSEDVSQRSTELFEELGKLRIQYGKKKESVVALTKENAALKHSGASISAGADEISKLIDEREDLLDTIAVLQASVEEQNEHLSDAAKDVDFLEKKVLKVGHQLDKMTVYRAQNKELSSQLQQLRHENNELVKQAAHFQRTKDLKFNGGPGGAVFGLASKGMVQVSASANSNRSLMNEFAASSMSIPPPLRIGSHDSVPTSLPTTGLSATNKKLKITQDKLHDERKERKAAIELLKLVLTELDQSRAQGEEASNKPDKVVLTRQWMQMNGRQAGNQDFGYHDGEATMGLAVSEDDDSSVGLRAKLSKRSGDLEALEETEVSSFVQATEGLEHLLLGWHVLKHHPQKPSKAASQSVAVADMASLSLSVRSEGGDSFLGADKDRIRRVQFNDVTTVHKVTYNLC
jgi:chromosome segregation ATPase